MKIITALSILIVAALALPAFAQPIVIRDTIPNFMSNETEGNVEPFIVFNPADPHTLVISAAFFANAGSTLGPLLVSFDDGNTWNRRDIVPTCTGCLNTGDTTMSYNASGRFFAGILGLAAGGSELTLTSTDPTLTLPLVQIASASPRDQPYIQSTTVLGWYDPGKERTYLAAQTASGTSTARIDQLLDAGAAMPVQQSFNIDAGSPAVFDNFYVRPAVHPDGTVYTAFVRHLSNITGGVNAELVIRRDDAWAKTSPEYQSLNAASGVTVSTYPLTIDFSSSFAGERNAGDLALAIDPRDSRTVYLSYASRTSATQPINLHLLRSTTGGSTWSAADLLAITNAKNSSIAVNSQGHIAYLYQQVTGAAGSRHWVTHLRRSPNGTTWSDDTMSDFPGEGASAPPHPLGPYLGDYDRVINIGKNFYGVFTAGNAPATLPAGTSFLRNVSGSTLVGSDGVTPVPISMDPFFFRTTEMAPDADVYVRDWTDSATSHDPGLEPSTHNAFYVSSDVWNRRTNDPQPFVNDAPQQQDPHPAAFGHNYGFSRISRAASGSPQMVSVEYLYSDGGVGVNYVSAGTTTINIPAGATSATPGVGNGFQWDLPSGLSNHVCLATQISTAGDPYQGSTLAGRSPGWGGTMTDLEILNDNNKAQRNMQVYFGLSGTHDWAMVATIHNAASRTRDMQIGVDYDLGDIEGLIAPRIRFVGGSESGERIVLRPHTLYTLKGMHPGENRWIEITADGGGLKHDAAIQIYEIVGALPLNGYGFIFRPASADDVVRDNLFQHAVVMARLAAHGVSAAKQQAERALALLDAKRIDPAEYMKFAGSSLAILREGISLPHYPKVAREPFSLPQAVLALQRTADLAEFTAAHRSLLNRTDALISMTQKQSGDPADIWQMLRTQRDRASASGRFNNAELARITNRLLADPRADYPTAVRQLLPYLKDTAARSGDNELTARYATLAAARGVEATEKAHREFLWRMEDLEGK